MMPYMKIEYYENGKLKSIEAKGLFADVNIKNLKDKIK